MDGPVVGVKREEEELVFDSRRSAREDVLFSKIEQEDNEASTGILRSLYRNATISVMSEKLLMVKICCSILFPSKPRISTEVLPVLDDVVKFYFEDSEKAYSAWAAKMAVDLDTRVPWIMCKQDNAPEPCY